MFPPRTALRRRLPAALSAEKVAVTNPTKNLVSFLASSCLIAPVCLAVAYSIRHQSGELAFTAKVQELSLGQPVDTAVRRLGPPHEIAASFRLGQQSGFEDAYQRAAESTAVQYYTWQCCIDMTYTIGVDGEQRMVVIEYGGT